MTDDDGTSLIRLTEDADNAVTPGRLAGGSLRDIGLLPRLLGIGGPLSYDRKVTLLDPVEDRSLTRDLLRYWRVLNEVGQANGPKVRGPKIREFGHPQEWNSVKSQEIVDEFVRLRTAVEAGSLSLDKVSVSPSFSRQASALQAAVTVLHKQRALLPAVDSEIIRSMIALHKEIGTALGFLEPEPERAACVKCGEMGLMVQGDDDREFHCACGYSATADDYRTAVAAAWQALFAEDADEPVLVTIQYVANYFGVKYKTVEKWIEKKKLVVHGKDPKGRNQVDKREVQKLLAPPPSE